MIDLTINTQPDDETCGPTCLHAIYRYFGLEDTLEDIIHGVERSLSGGTLAPMLGNHALTKQFEATIYINNLDVFDPTWFHHDGSSDNALLFDKLEQQMRFKKNEAIVQSSQAYQNFIQLGGKVRFQTININMLKEYFKKKIPILTGLSATYLYRSEREHFSHNGISYSNDVQGTPCGHFVVLCGYDDMHRHIVVADPHRENPLSHNNYYKVNSPRLINAIMLGVLTYDANLLIIHPKEWHANDLSH